MNLSRRQLLRGAGITLPLPWLEAMARPASAKRGQAAPPTRVVVMYVPNGAVMQRFTPKIIGMDFDLPPTLEPLVPHRNDLLILSGLSQEAGRSNGDGNGDHSRAMGTFLTGVRIKKSVTDVRAGVSFDQVAAARIGKTSRLPSLELTCENEARMSPVAGDGYSDLYIFHLSWKTPTLPLELEGNPGMAFDRILGVSSEVSRSRSSLLDLVLEDTHTLSRNVGARDRHKLDEYTTSLREVEQRLQRFGGTRLPTPQGFDRPAPPTGFQEHVRLMCDIIALAFRVDATRIVTFAPSREASGRILTEAGVYEQHHYLSHHQKDAQKLDMVARIDRFYVQQFAYLLQKLKDVRDQEDERRSLLDSTLVLYGSGLSDGNHHNHNDLPIILAGRGNGSVSPGRHVHYPNWTPLNNLYLSLLDRLGAPVDRFGNSTGRLSGLV